MNKEILYTTALDNNGNLIHIDHAEKGVDYYCPECKTEFILRKSGKTGKGSKRPHFAHNQLTTNCTAESVLHYSFKIMLIDLLENYRLNNKSLEMNWHCTGCSNPFSGNILDKVASIRKEYSLNACIPDIALFNAEENVFAVIEIVVTHQPEEHVLQFYKENNIILIQINLSSDEDLRIVEEKIIHPDIVDYCLNPLCNNYIKYMINRKIKIEPFICGRCFQPNEKYYIEVNSVFGKQTSMNFTEDEINIVKSNRSSIKIVKDKSNNASYPISVCMNCKRMQSKYRRRRF